MLKEDLVHQAVRRGFSGGGKDSAGWNYAWETNYVQVLFGDDTVVMPGDRFEDHGIEDGSRLTFQVEPVSEIDCFDDLQLSKAFDDEEFQEIPLRAIYMSGYEKPSPIQSRAIAPIAMGCDTVIEAPGETGKTVAVAIGVVQRVNPMVRSVQLLMVVSETQAQQVQHYPQLIENLSFPVCERSNKQLRVVVDDHITDGQSVDAAAHCLCVTPSILTSLLERNCLELSHLECVVFDALEELAEEGAPSSVKPYPQPQS